MESVRRWRACGAGELAALESVRRWRVSDYRSPYRMYMPCISVRNALLAFVVSPEPDF